MDERAWRARMKAAELWVAYGGGKGQAVVLYLDGEIMLPPRPTPPGMPRVFARQECLCVGGARIWTPPA